jgi:hypothetical protein
MLAAARGEKKSPPAGATEHETASDAAGVEASAAPKAVEKTEKQPAKSAEAPKAEKKGAPPNSAADIIAMCRQQDAKK